MLIEHADTMFGLVIELKRPESALDAIEWYCFECGIRAHRAELVLKSILDDLPPIYATSYADVSQRTYPSRKAVQSGKELLEGWVQL